MRGAYFFFFKQKTAYEMRISDWSSDVCSSDLIDAEQAALLLLQPLPQRKRAVAVDVDLGEHGEVHVVGQRTEFPDRRLVARLLVAELVAGETDRKSVV